MRGSNPHGLAPTAIPPNHPHSNQDTPRGHANFRTHLRPCSRHSGLFAYTECMTAATNRRDRRATARSRRRARRRTTQIGASATPACGHNSSDRLQYLVMQRSSEARKDCLSGCAMFASVSSCLMLPEESGRVHRGGGMCCTPSLSLMALWDSKTCK